MTSSVGRMPRRTWSGWLGEGVSRRSPQVAFSHLHQEGRPLFLHQGTENTWGEFAVSQGRFCRAPHDMVTPPSTSIP